MSDLLRLATAGSVDDGKSTLIGRLLYDAKAVLEDQLAHVAAASEHRGDGTLDLSLLTDGLRAEREQGITIDVAYRYFATARREFILADTPGHVQYTRNMVTGASTADLAMVLIDARKGVLEQSRRHLFLASLLGVSLIVVCVNKMDLVDWDQGVFDRIVSDVRAFAGVAAFVPLSALLGDNVVDRSAHMDWYDGPPLLDLLETIEVPEPGEGVGARFPVQWVIRAGDERRYAGQIAGGTLRPGDDVVILPSGRRSQIATVETFDGPLGEAHAPLSVSISLTDDVDVSRGDLICHPDSEPDSVRELVATVCWMADVPLRPGATLALKHTSNSVRAKVEAVVDRVDVHTLRFEPGVEELTLNEIGHVRLRTSAPVLVDPYAANRVTGSFILIDEATNDTVAAGLVG
jgi:sulfate adenylyltransferase large subunit